MKFFIFTTLILRSGKHGNTISWLHHFESKEEPLKQQQQKKQARELSDLTLGEHMVPVFQDLSWATLRNKDLRKITVSLETENINQDILFSF